MNLLRSLGKVEGEKQNSRELGELRGLDREKPDFQEAVGIRRFAGEQHNAQQSDCPSKNEKDDPLDSQLVIVHEHQNTHHQQSDSGRNRLLENEAQRAIRGARCCAENHHEAEEHQP